MQGVSNTAALSERSFLKGLLPSLLLNIALPLALYFLVKRFVTSSEIVALSVASLFPLVESMFSVVRHRSLDILAIVTLLATGTGIVGALLGGSEDLILLRELFFTGALGIACFVSLGLSRPLMFYFGRHLATGRDPEKLARFNAGWHHPTARFAHRLITIVWGCAFVGEFLIRVLFVVTLPHVLVLAISPVLRIGTIILTMLWAFAYIRSVSWRRKEMLEHQQ